MTNEDVSRYKAVPTRTEIGVLGVQKKKEVYYTQKKTARRGLDKVHWVCSRGSHRKQEHFLVACKTYTKPSAFVKYVIKSVGATNPIADSKFVEEYVMNNKANQIF